MAGYSATPLAKKLGLKPGMLAAVQGAPWDYRTQLGLDFAPVALAADAPLPAGLNYLHIFTQLRMVTKARLRDARDGLHKDGMIWVSWPKKASGLPSEINGDVLREICLPMGLVDIKVCAVDEIWSGLKMVIRKALR
ncbi:MAG: hypothetical protein JKX69_02865 [Rhodobacteraceae bacterium]|nr:hypothetical protein [Paracoccaceae bacterium]